MIGHVQHAFLLNGVSIDGHRGRCIKIMESLNRDPGCSLALGVGEASIPLVTCSPDNGGNSRIARIHRADFGWFTMDPPSFRGQPAPLTGWEKVEVAPQNPWPVLLAQPV